ncbi:MAG: PaaI family thioesterase [Desulfovibrionaceae bacterium]|nr:PaaI family thioesterase [Desulfovibrionaceae bacterium]MDD4951465.1 PaaI family thioesterase [Desulfovibrionaceae bacterium]
MTDYLKLVQEPGQTVNPLFAFLGVRVEEISGQRAVLRLDLKPEFVQGAGKVAGGIVATLLDEAMAHAVMASLEPGQATATTGLNVRYFRPADKGQGLRAEARLARRGRRLAFVEAEASIDGQVVAKADAQFLVL